MPPKLLDLASRGALLCHHSFPGGSHVRLVQRMGAILTALILITGIGVQPHAASAGNVTYLSLSTGHSIVLTIPGLRRVAVGDSPIDGVVPSGTGDLVVHGRGGGHAPVDVGTASGRTAYQLRVS